MADALRHALEHRQRHGRPAATEIEDNGARHEEGPRGSDGDGRGDVRTAIEQWRLAKRRARPLGMEHLFSATEGELADLDCAVADDEEPAALLPLLEEELTWAEYARDASSGQATELSRRQGAKVCDASKEFCLSHGPLGCHHVDLAGFYAYSSI